MVLVCSIVHRYLFPAKRYSIPTWKFTILSCTVVHSYLSIIYLCGYIKKYSYQVIGNRSFWGLCFIAIQCIIICTNAVVDFIYRPFTAFVVRPIRTLDRSIALVGIFTTRSRTFLSCVLCMAHVTFRSRPYR